MRKLITNQEYIITIWNLLVRPATLIFKLIMHKMAIGTCATTSTCRDDISNLDHCMATFNSKIEAFNFNINHIIRSLLAYGEIDNIITNLFKGYKIASDVKFVARIGSWEINWL